MTTKSPTTAPLSAEQLEKAASKVKVRHMFASTFFDGIGRELAIATTDKERLGEVAADLLAVDELDQARVYEVAIIPASEYAALMIAQARAAEQPSGNSGELVAQARAAQEADYDMDDRDLARKILVFMGRATPGSNEPGADPLADRLAEKLATWRPQALPPQPVREQDERALFEAWHRSKFATKHSTGQPTRDMHNGIYAEQYGPANQQQMWEAWQARAAVSTRASSAPEIIEPVLPPWPEPISTATDIAPWLTDKQIVDALHSLGIDTEMSKYGFSDIQVRGTTVPGIRRLIVKLATPAATASSAPAEPEGWRAFIENCSRTAGVMVHGNRLAIAAKNLLAATPTATTLSDTADQFAAAVDAEYPMPDNPHASVIRHATDNRAAMWRGINAACVILGSPPSAPATAGTASDGPLTNEGSIPQPAPSREKDAPAEDAVVEANRQLLLDRSRIGIAKYGVTLAAGGLSRTQFAQHALEEALDLANYLQGIIQIDAAAVAPADDAQTDAARDVLAERRRQVEAEGYDHENDDEYVNDEVAAASAFYVMPPGVREWAMNGSGYGATMGQAIYPDWMPPKIGDRRRELVKGAALALAEIERFDRAASQQGAKEGGAAC